MTESVFDITLIKHLSSKEPKSILERFVKLSEECGELAQELLIHKKVSGTHHKKVGEDGILGEAVDVMLVAISIFFCAGGTAEELATISQKKCAKWQQFQSGVI